MNAIKIHKAVIRCSICLRTTCHRITVVDHSNAQLQSRPPRIRGTPRKQCLKSSANLCVSYWDATLRRGSRRLTDILEIFPNVYNFADMSTRFLAWIAALAPSVNWSNRQLPNLLVGNENDLFIMVTLSASNSSHCFV